MQGQRHRSHISNRCDLHIVAYKIAEVHELGHAVILGLGLVLVVWSAGCRLMMLCLQGTDAGRKGVGGLLVGLLLCLLIVQGVRTVGMNAGIKGRTRAGRENENEEDGRDGSLTRKGGPMEL